MPPSKRRRKKPQRYDTSFKHWVEQQASEILPVLLPGAVYEKTLTVEIIRSVMRADKVFKILYCGEEHILHLEFETGLDRQLRSRLLVYNSVLYRDYQLPVITIVVYPFSVEPAISPLCIKSNGEDILTFRFKTLPLFTMEAEQFVQEHRACMYPLLPTMHGVHAELIAQAMQELAELYRDDEMTLAQQFVWMQLLLERTDTVQSLEKSKIEERLKMFDQLWNESPRIQKMKKQFREQAQKEAREEVKQETEQKLAKWRRETEQKLVTWQKEAEQERVRLQKEADQERVRLQKEADQAQKEAEQERVRLQKEADQAQKEAEQERVRLQKEADQAQKEAEQERVRLQKEAEQAQKEAEQERVRLQKEAEQAEKVRTDQEVERLRRALVSVAHARFPNLTGFVQQQVELFDRPEVLDLLIQQIAVVPDANTARLLLNPSSEAHE